MPAAMAASKRGRPQASSYSLRRVDLCRGLARKRGVAQNRGQHVAHVIRGANVAGAGCQCSHPHVFVRDAVRANDGQCGKVAVQTLYIIQQPVLQVEHHGLRAGSGYVLPQFFAGAGYVHRKVSAEFTGQRSGHPRVLFENDYTLCHNSPDLSTFVNGGRQHRTGAAGWLREPQLHRHRKLPNRGQNSARLNAVLATFLSALRRVQLEASRSSSTEFQLFLPPAPVLSGKPKKVACLLQTVSATFLKGLLPFPVPEQFASVAGGTLQT